MFIIPFWVIELIQNSGNLDRISKWGKFDLTVLKRSTPLAIVTGSIILLSAYFPALMKITYYWHDVRILFDCGSQI